MNILQCLSPKIIVVDVERNVSSQKTLLLPELKTCISAESAAAKQKCFQNSGGHKHSAMT
jgi:hypothetical protein